MAGRKVTGLFPFEPSRVLKDLLKYPASLVVPIADKAMEVCQPAEVPLTPATPVTPVKVEALTLLYDASKHDTLARTKMRTEAYDCCPRLLRRMLAPPGPQSFPIYDRWRS